MGRPRRRGPSYPPDVIRTARALKLDGETPSNIVRMLAEEYPELEPPLSTVKSWTDGIKPLGTGRPWDFVKATPAERILAAPLFAGFERKSLAVDHWPAQDVADWVVRIRQFRLNWWFDEVHRRAQLLAHYDRVIADGTATPDDKRNRDLEIADLMNEAGSEQLNQEAARQDEIRREVEDADRTPSRTP